MRLLRFPIIDSSLPEIEADHFPAAMRGRHEAQFGGKPTTSSAGQPQANRNGIVQIEYMAARSQIECGRAASHRL
jgi:hypothetical protein